MLSDHMHRFWNDSACLLASYTLQDLALHSRSRQACLAYGPVQCLFYWHVWMALCSRCTGVCCSTVLQVSSVVPLQMHLLLDTLHSIRVCCICVTTCTQFPLIVLVRILSIYMGGQLHSNILLSQKNYSLKKNISSLCIQKGVCFSRRLLPASWSAAADNMKTCMPSSGTHWQ
jgi:hypothetical protein